MLRSLRLLAQFVLIALLIVPGSVSANDSSFTATDPDQPGRPNGETAIYLPIVYKIRYYFGSKACLVTDTGGIDDQSFNERTWEGVQDSVHLWQIEGSYLESVQQSDYSTHINTFINDGCDVIITVGFTMVDATLAAATAHPAQKFSIVDWAYDPSQANILGQVFAIDQAAFLAGYLAAGVTNTGKVATFGGIQFPTVTAFMDGFALGVRYYNQQHGTNVEVLGWDPDTQTGLFSGSFTSFDDGYAIGNSLIAAGADIIMPVAGTCGLGAAAAASEHSNIYIIGVDTDWYYTFAAYQAIILTSVMKNMDMTTFNAIRSVLEGTFVGGTLVGDLENHGVGLAPFHDLAGLVSSQLLAELEAVRAGIINGTIITTP